MSRSIGRNTRPKLLFILCVAGFSLTFLNGMVSPLLPLFAQGLGASGTLIGMVSSSFFLFRLFLEIPLGYMSDKIGRRTPIVLSLFITVTASIFCGFVLDSYQLILTRALWGLGTSLFFCTTSVLIIDIFGPKSSERTLGILVGIENGGLSLGSFWGGYLASLFNYRIVFFISGVILIPTSFFCFVSRDLKSLGSAERLRSQKKATHNSIKFLKSRRLISVCCIAFFIFVVYQGIILTVFPLYAYNSLNFDVSMIGVLISMAGIGLFLSPFMVGFISEKIGQKRLLFIAISFLSLSMYLLSFTGSFDLFIPLMFISGCAKGFVLALGPILAVEATGFSARGTAVGTFRTSFALGSIVGPVVMAIIASSFDVSTVFYFAALLALVTIMPIVDLSARDKPVVEP
jgi:MFS family permease